MNASQKKVVQYLGEAHASEQALTRVLQSQIAMTPRGAYRTALEQHLRQTRDHAERVGERLQELGHGGDPLTAAVGFVETVVAQALALAQDAVRPAARLRRRGEGAQERQGRLRVRGPGDRDLHGDRASGQRGRATTQTAKLAASILADEEKMLERVLREIPKLTDAVVRADVKGNPSYDVTHDRRRRRGPRRRRGREGRGADDDRPRQAHRAPGAQGAGRRPGRGPDQGRRRVRGRPRDRPLRRADRRGDRGPARRALADRPGQDRLLRAQEPEPHHGPRPHHHAAWQRAVGRLRRADRGRGAGRPRRGRRRPRRSRSAPTSAATRTAPAS